MPLLKCSNVLFVGKVALSALTIWKFSLHTFALPLCPHASLLITVHFPPLYMHAPPSSCPCNPFLSVSPPLPPPFPFPHSLLAPRPLSLHSFPFSHPFTLLLFPSSSLHDHSFSRRVHVHWTSWLQSFSCGVLISVMYWRFRLIVVDQNLFRSACDGKMGQVNNLFLSPHHPIVCTTSNI